MAEEEVIDAESSTLSKNTSPLDHLRHLIKVGWDPNTPLIVKFVDKYGLDDELREMIKDSKNK
ncbi:MAG: hypothetical protein HOA17_02970 [Candidatus Melainabacteria bacterium]|jgi:hypothetical protein|nr:hypothetical protein [Candidatus Melainabacteria bacterium]